VVCVCATIAAGFTALGTGVMFGPPFAGWLFDQVRKRHFGAICIVELIILPRRARDKHRENSKTSGVFLQRGNYFLSFGIAGAAIWMGAILLYADRLLTRKRAGSSGSSGGSVAGVPVPEPDPPVAVASQQP
jgi:MFS family permease